MQFYFGGTAVVLLKWKNDSYSQKYVNTIKVKISLLSLKNKKKTLNWSISWKWSRLKCLELKLQPPMWGSVKRSRDLDASYCSHLQLSETKTAILCHHPGWGGGHCSVTSFSVCNWFIWKCHVGGVLVQHYEYCVITTLEQAVVAKCIMYRTLTLETWDHVLFRKLCTFVV